MFLDYPDKITPTHSMFLGGFLRLFSGKQSLVPPNGTYFRERDTNMLNSRTKRSVQRDKPLHWGAPKQ